MAQKHIIVENLVKTFDKGKVKAVDHVSLEVQKGEFLTLLGPSGCGKTTILRCLAGLERPSSGRISFGDQIVYSDQEKVFVKSEKRKVGMVFQSYSVWPHMTVMENVAFPLEVQKFPRKEIRQRVIKALELVNLGDLGERIPSQLSGGQQQRVALARAIVTEPDIILFDEPLSNLDFKLREQMRFELLRLQSSLDITSVYVTHDQSEAMVLSDRVMVMDKGKIIQIGSPEEIYNKPRNAFVASFVGLINSIPGRIRISDDKCHIETALGIFQIPASQAQEFSDGQNASLFCRPENIVIHHQPVDSKDNTFYGEVDEIAFLGDHMDIIVRTKDLDIRIQSHPDAGLKVGADLWIEFPVHKCGVLSRED